LQEFLKIRIAMDKCNFDFKDRVVVITGGSSGLGRAISEAFAYKDANVIVGDINKIAGENFTKALKSKNYKVDFEYVDVMNEELVNHFIKNVYSKYGKLDVLVNSAGINIRKPIIETTVDDLMKVLNINFVGTFLMNREVLKPMINNNVKGKIINLASIFGAIAYKGQCSYAASKGAVIQFTKVAAIESAGYGICVNAIAPSYIETPLVKPLIENRELYNELKNKNPMKKFGQPEDVVGTALFLASSMADFITGQTIFVDGGWTIW
jgi:NAD(P)-dependent dehydrogenase (short-subunit alcohol dehydrogenase family)